MWLSLDTNFVRDINLLLHGAHWVIFRFADGSCKKIYTSLDSEIVGDKIKSGFLFDMLTQRFLSLERVEGALIEIYEQEPLLEGVDLFANRYIL